MLEKADALQLVQAWRDFTSLSQAARCWYGELSEPLSPVVARRMAGVLGLPDFKSLSGRLAELRIIVRALFERMVGAVR